jgi:hypothetical protein
MAVQRRMAVQRLVDDWARHADGSCGRARTGAHSRETTQLADRPLLRTHIPDPTEAKRLDGYAKL